MSFFLRESLSFYVLIFSFLLIASISADTQNSFIKGSPKLAYWKVGGQPGNVIILHGGPGVTHNYLRPEWDRLTDSATIIYYDQRGNGKSEKADCYSWRMHVEDLYRLIKELFPGQKVILAGSSWGSELAILFTNTYPDLVKGLILSGTVKWQGKGKEMQDCENYAPHEMSKEEEGEFYEAIKKFIGDKDSTFFQRQPSGLVPEEEKAMRSKTIRADKMIAQETVHSLNDAPTLNQMNTNVPILIFQGLEPCRFSDVSNQYANLSSYSEIVYIEKACHDPWLVNPDKFFEKCAEFIRKISNQ